MGLFDKTVARSLNLIPKPVVRRVARRYVAGDKAEEALREARRLNQAGCHTTMDLLGESVTDAAEATADADAYLDLLDQIHREQVDASVSIKPTQFGLSIDKELFIHNVRRVVQRARDLNNVVRIDMEDSPTTDATLDGYRQLRDEGFDNVGLVLQARLRRTLADLKALQPYAPSVRLCKGVYIEPEDIAWQSYDEVNKAFLEQLAYTLPNPAFTMAIGTHDDPIIQGAEQLISQHGLAPERYEFQMLLGVRPEVRETLIKKGHPVRVYVPFGKDWYAYCVRRLKENPQFAGYVTKDLLRDPTQLFGKANR